MTVGLNRVGMSTATTGTGTITLGSALTGYATVAEAGGVNATAYTYLIEEGSDFEIGTGTYTSSGTTLSRDTVKLSKISGTAGTTKMTLAGAARVYITVKDDDLISPASSDTLTNKALTSPDIDGGTIDNCIIGGSTAAAGNFTQVTYASLAATSSIAFQPSFVVANEANDDAAPLWVFTKRKNGGATAPSAGTRINWFQFAVDDTSTDIEVADMIFDIESYSGTGQANVTGGFNIYLSNGSGQFPVFDGPVFHLYSYGDVDLKQPNKSYTHIKTARTELTSLSGATATATSLIPAGAVVVGVSTRVTTAITGATSFSVGDGSDVDRWGASIAVASGTQTNNSSWTVGTVECFPSTTNVVLTANGPNFTGGAVRIIVHYITVTAPAS